MSGVMIDPKYIYLIETVGSLKTMCTIVAVIAAIGAGISIITLMEAMDLSCGDKMASTSKKLAVIFGIIAFMFTIFAVFVPSRVAMIEITIARYATYENASATIEQIKGVADYVIDAISKLK